MNRVVKASYNQRYFLKYNSSDTVVSISTARFYMTFQGLARPFIKVHGHYDFHTTNNVFSVHNLDCLVFVMKKGKGVCVL